MIERLAAFFRSLAAFDRSFWVANLTELFERVAFYGMTPMLVLYVTESRGVEQAAAIRLSGNFGFVVYGLPVLSGFIADLMGYRRAMMLAYGLLTSGYVLTGLAPSYWLVAAALLPVAVGASVIKPVVTGTVQKTCGTEEQRAVGFSIYYMLVNVGAWVGPTLAGLVAERHGVGRVFWLSAGAAAVALVMAAVAYREPAGAGEGRRALGDLPRDFLRVLASGRVALLFLFLAGFWSMFFQFFGALPLYLRDDLHLGPKVLGFILGLEAAAIIVLQVVVGYVTRRLGPLPAVLLGVLIASAGTALIGVVPSPVAAGVGVIVFALGEMTYSAHFYKYCGSLAPPGQVGMYMGFAFLPIALGSLLAGQIGGPIAAHFRETLHRPAWMWFAFAGVGLVAALGIAALALLPGPTGKEV